MSRVHPPAALVALFAASLAIRVVFLALPFAELDRGFVPDDTYYTASVARNLALGRGPVADGEHPTNGFQPLLAFLLVPFYWLPLGAEAPIRVACLLGALADSLAAVLLCLLASASWGRPAGWFAGWIWALSPIALANALCGLETSLALAVGLALVLATERVARAGAARPLVTCGLLAGAAVLTRIDTAVLCVIVAAVVTRRSGLGATLRVAGVAFLVVAPWWLYQLSRFGTVVPESGAAVRLQAAVHQGLGLTPAQQVLWALGYALSPVVDPQGLRDLLASSPLARVAAAAAAAAALWWIARPALRAASAAVRMFAAFAAAILAFYAFGVPAVWFFKRYLIPLEALSVLLVAWTLARLVERWRARLALPACLALAVLPGALQLAQWAFRGKPIERGYHGAKGYARPAQLVLGALAQRGAPASLGAFQAGALAYFAEGLAGRPIRVVNLDGVVNRSAYVALRERRLLAYLRRERIEYFADWRFNVDALYGFAEAPGDLRLQVLFEAPSQGGTDHFLLVRVDLAPVSPAGTEGDSVSRPAAHHAPQASRAPA